jgi:hypothetical protein
MQKVTIELDVQQAQELASTARTTIKKIDWVLENTPPKKPGQAADLDARAKILTLAANTIEAALHARALENADKHLGDRFKVVN